MEKDLAMQTPERRFSKLRRGRAIGVFVATIELFVGGVVGATPVHESKQSEKPPAVAAMAQHKSGGLDDLKIVVVNDPSVENLPRHSDQEIKDAFDEADDRITESTNNKLSLPNSVKLLVGELAIHSVNDETKELCYSGDVLLEFGKEMKDYPDQDIALILNETPGCSEIRGAAAWAYPAEKVIVYGSAQKLGGGVIAHEIGHTRDFDHHASVVCADRAKDEPYSSYNLVQLLEEGKCGVTRRENGTIDEYTANSSVMGNAYQTQYAELYHPLELAKLDPNVIVQKLPSNEFIQPVVADGPGVRGVKMDVPLNHPLRSVDPGVDTLSVTVQQRSDPNHQGRQVEVIVTASSDKLLYDLPLEQPIILCMEKEHDCANSIMQRVRGLAVWDELLNVYIMVEKNKDGSLQIKVDPMNG